MLFLNIAFEIYNIKYIQLLYIIILKGKLFQKKKENVRKRNSRWLKRALLVRDPGAWGRILLNGVYCITIEVFILTADV